MAGIAVHVDCAVMHAELANPPANALDLAMIGSLRELVRSFTASEANVLVLSSATPGYFATGADLPPAGFDPIDPLDYSDALRDVLAALDGCRRPVIAAIDGAAVSAGVELVTACALRVASPAASFSMPEVTRGSIPSGGAAQRLPSLVGRGRALELMLTGREVACDEAARIGLVDRVHVDAVGEALQLARALAGHSVQAVAAILSCVDAGRDLTREDALTVERVAFASMFEDQAVV